MDALRAFGMVAVAATHAHFATLNQSKWGFEQELNRVGEVGLSIFFVISGFLITRPFAYSVFADRPRPATKRFLRRRFLRILPAYWVTLTVVIVAFGLQVAGDDFTRRSATPLDYLLNYTLLQHFVPSRSFSGIHVSYTIVVEFLFYLLLPGLTVLLARAAVGRDLATRVRLALAGAAAIYLGATAARVYAVLAKPALESVIVQVLPGRIDAVAIGMACGVLSAAAQCGWALPRLVERLGRHPALSVAAGVALVFALAPVHEPGPGDFTLELPLRFGVAGVAGALIVAPAMFGDQQRGAIRWVLRNPALAWLGTVSFGFYLIHLTLLDEVVLPALGIEAGSFRGNYPLVLLLVFALATVYGAASYYAVERPSLRRSDRPLFARRAASPAREGGR